MIQLNKIPFTIQVRRGLETDLPTDPALFEGEFGFCTDTYKLYVGTASVSNKQVATEGKDITLGDITLSGTNRRITFNAGDYVECLSGYWRFRASGDVVFAIDATRTAWFGHHVDIQEALSGNLTLYIQNLLMHSSANARLYLGALGKAFIYFETTGAGSWCTGLDNTDANFVICTGSTPGDTKELSITTTGRVILGGTNREIQFDVDDYLEYASNAWGWYIGNTLEATLDTSGLHLWGTTRRVAYDTGDFWDFTTGTNLLEWNVGAATKLAVGADGKLDSYADLFRLRTSKTPASASDTGNVGDICWDSQYIYICIATNTWRRMGHDTW